MKFHSVEHGSEQQFGSCSPWDHPDSTTVLHILLLRETNWPLFGFITNGHWNYKNSIIFIFFNKNVIVFRISLPNSNICLYKFWMPLSVDAIKRPIILHFPNKWLCIWAITNLHIVVRQSHENISTKSKWWRPQWHGLKMYRRTVNTSRGGAVRRFAVKVGLKSVNTSSHRRCQQISTWKDCWGGQKSFISLFCWNT